MLILLSAALLQVSKNLCRTTLGSLFTAHDQPRKGSWLPIAEWAFAGTLVLTLWQLTSMPGA